MARNSRRQLRRANRISSSLKATMPRGRFLCPIIPAVTSSSFLRVRDFTTDSKFPDIRDASTMAKRTKAEPRFGGNESFRNAPRRDEFSILLVQWIGNATNSIDEIYILAFWRVTHTRTACNYVYRSKVSILKQFERSFQRGRLRVLSLGT